MFRQKNPSHEELLRCYSKIAEEYPLRKTLISVGYTLIKTGFSSKPAVQEGQLKDWSIQYQIVLTNLRQSAEIYEDLARQKGFKIEAPVSTLWEGKKMDKSFALVHGFSRYDPKAFYSIARVTVSTLNGYLSIMARLISKEDVKYALELLASAIEDTACLICIMREWLIPLMNGGKNHH